MQIILQPTTAKIETNTCNFHKKNPGKQFPGCTCSTVYTSVPVSSVDDISKRLFEEYDELWKELAKV